jgi:hypothetical protein
MKYVTNCRNLKLYLKHGLQLTKIHRVLMLNSVLADTHPARHNLSHYKPYENSLNQDQLTFPLPNNQISSLSSKKNNGDISVNVLSEAKKPDNLLAAILYYFQRSSEQRTILARKLSNILRAHAWRV